MRVTLLPLMLLGCQEGLVLDSYDQHAWTQAADAVAAEESLLPWLEQVDPDGALGEDAAFVLASFDGHEIAPHGVHAQDLALNAIKWGDYPDVDVGGLLEQAPDWPDGAYRIVDASRDLLDPVVLLKDPRWLGRDEVWLATVRKIVEHPVTDHVFLYLRDELPIRLRSSDRDLDEWLARSWVLYLDEGAAPEDFLERLPAYARLEDPGVTSSNMGRLAVHLHAQELARQGWEAEADARWRTLLDEKPDLFRVNAAYALLRSRFASAESDEELDEVEMLLEHMWATERIETAIDILKAGVPQFLARKGRLAAARRWLERAPYRDAVPIAAQLGMDLGPPPRPDWSFESGGWWCCYAQLLGATTVVPRVGRSSAPQALPLVQPRMDACGHSGPALAQRIDDIAACVDASPLEDLVEVVIPLDDQPRDPPVDELERCLTEVASSIEPGPPTTWRVRVIDRTH